MANQDELELLQELGDTVGTPKLKEKVRMSCNHVDVFYNETAQAIFDVSVDLGKNQILAMIGPSGCGKSTLLRCLNRMNDTIDGCIVNGEITLDGEDIYNKTIDPVLLRANVGMVFQKPTHSQNQYMTMWLMDLDFMD